MKKFYKPLLIVSLCLNFIVLIFFVGKRIYYAKSYELGLKNLKELRVLPINDSSIVFVGNSLTEGFPIEEMFAIMPVKNRGISGNTSTDILARITPITEANPRKIFLDVGINDILKNIPLDTLYINYKHIIEIIKSKSPTSKIYIQSLLPVGKKYKSLIPTIIKFNDTLKNFCSTNSIVFINLFPLFYFNGILDPYYTYDGIHLNRSAYEVWRNAIARYVN